MLIRKLLKPFYCIPLLLILPSGVVFGALYKWVDEKGNTHYSDVAPTKNVATTQQIHLEPLNSIESVHINKNGVVNDKQTIDNNEKKRPEVAHEASKLSAKSCFGPSPKTSNTLLVRTSLEKTERKDILSLLKKMKGQWKGVGVLTACSGTKITPSIESSEFETTADIQFRRSKEVRIEFDMYSSKLRKAINENIKLFVSEQHLSFSPSQSDESVLMHSSANTIELWVEQYPFNGVHSELVRVFNMQSNTMEIEQYSYSNGELESSLIWKLTKR